MKYSTKLSDAIHILVLIAIQPPEELSSAAIAKSIATNPAFVRQIMSSLKKAGLIDSVPGHPQPTLKKEACQMSMFDIYHAVEGDKPLLHLDTHTNRECGIGVGIQVALKDYYDEIQQLAELRMKQITLQNIIDTYNRNKDSEQILHFFDTIA